MKCSWIFCWIVKIISGSCCICSFKELSQFSSSSKQQSHRCRMECCKAYLSYLLSSQKTLLLQSTVSLFHEHVGIAECSFIFLDFYWLSVSPACHKEMWHFTVKIQSLHIYECIFKKICSNFWLFVSDDPWTKILLFYVVYKYCLFKLCINIGYVSVLLFCGGKNENTGVRPCLTFILYSLCDSGQASWYSWSCVLTSTLDIFV